MTTLRVMIVDEEVIVRQGLSARLGKGLDFHVAGVCSSLEQAGIRLESSLVEILIIDLEVPPAELASAVNELEKKHHELRVILVVPSETFYLKIVSAGIKQGRCEYVVRPRLITTIETFLDELAAILRKKISSIIRLNQKSKLPGLSTSDVDPVSLRVMKTAQGQNEANESRDVDKTTAASEPKSSLPGARRRSGNRVEIVVIASSTGGPNALFEVLSVIPKGFQVPILIVQHMPAEFTKSLAERLDSQCQIDVKEGASGDHIRAGLALIAPGDQHMSIVRLSERHAVVELDHGPPENSCRPAADVLFRSAARVYGEHVLAVVLTGMGKDGLAGSRLIHDAGGQVIAQDEASSVVWGMPGEIAKANLADAVIPLREIALEMIRRIKVGRT